MLKYTAEQHNTQRITITVDKKIINEIRNTTKNISAFFNEAAKKEISIAKRQDLVELMQNIKKVTPIEPSLVTIRKGRDEELA